MPADLARILRFAASYLEEHGRSRFRFGDTGNPMCPAAAIAVALGLSARGLGRSRWFWPGSRTQEAVGTVILRSGLLDALPVPAPPYGTRKIRPHVMTARRAVPELARWNDDKALDSMVVQALRDQARRVSIGAASQPVSLPSPSAAW